MSSTNRQQLANAIRVLSADAVQQAKSGHPGAPMGMADIAEVLWNDFLVHNPANPKWVNRDRFVMSNGHGSMLVYSLLHLSGYDVSADDLKNFRQLHSKTPGHPELGYTPGVETTTGPLGQGIANAVGMAIAERTLAAEFNTDAHAVVDHHTYVFMGDGCLMEGISHEAASLAGTLGLGKLIVFWDDNGISIDGEVEGWFTDDTPARFEAYGWQVVPGVDGHDPEALVAAIKQAKVETSKPTLICCKTVIGKGSPNKEGTESCHGAPLGDEEVALVRERLGWDAAPFEVPAEIQKAWSAVEKGAKAEADWQSMYDEYVKANPAQAAEFERRMRGDLPADWTEKTTELLTQVDAAQATMATRKASLQSLNQLGPLLPELIGGSADLAGSNYTIWNDSQPISKSDAKGNYVYYGVREFAMSAISNGIALHGGFRTYAGTFLVFADYMRNGMRMSALMKQPVTYVLTHDSIGLGEDGPTHQPVEHVASLRLIPNMSVWRPCDAVESFVAWRLAAESDDKPTSLILSRQNLPHQVRSTDQLADIEKGGYVLFDSAETPELILIATGSEVALAMDAAKKLSEEGRAVRVVSMPSTDYFDAQDAEYKEQVLPSSVTKRVALEAGIADYWYKYVGMHGAVVGMTSFGESAPANQLFDYFGFNVDNVLDVIRGLD
ncbi:transketolase 1 [Arenicella chitinivorans]|uniref:Transketolase n=1 Tax=Arenicella chitinivorans TaxID=1329800 RepID=A0A918RUH2_9GAMM|nr:transketolase [Arenicella chitinivorans]GHA11627.1 transketolase 1 [Arenicella chitinivorans]